MIKSDLPNRDELERKLAKVLGKNFRWQLRELLDELGDPPLPDRLPPDFWEKTGLESVIEPELIGTFLTAAEGLMLEINIGVEWGLVNQRAIDWGRPYTFDLVRGINTTTQGVLRTAMESYYRDKLTKDQLAALLEPSFGPIRAEMIAITETTRAGVEGERELVRQIEAANQNIKMMPIWQTANDDRVCPICGPRHGKPIDDGYYPPAHPRCRCWVNHEMTVVE